MTIYMVKNLVDGKVYIGQTTQPLEKRWYQHLQLAKTGSPAYLHRAIQKYGHGSFEVRPLCSALSKDALSILEQSLITFFRSNDQEYGYNMSAGGEGMVDPNEEIRRKRGNAVKGEKNGMFGKGRKGKDSPMYGKHHSEESKEKQRIKMRPQRIGQKNPFFGRHHSDETRQRWSRSRTGEQNPAFGKDRSEIVKRGHQTRRKNREAREAQSRGVQ